MPTFRFPALVCRDAAGAFSAIAIGHPSVGFGTTANHAREDLREHLAREAKKQRLLRGADFHDPELAWHAVAVRPEYRTDARTFPCEGHVELRVACVVGTCENGQATAELPLFDVRFDYANAAELPDLVRRYALQTLEGLAPEQLGRYLPPAGVELIEVTVRGPKESSYVPPPAAPPTLAKVAEPVGERATRKGFARAWERDDELAAFARRLIDDSASLLLVGESGVGKTTLLVDAVKLAEKERAAEKGASRQRRFWLTSAGRLVAGMKYLGQWEERVEALIGELGEISGALCVERLLDLVQRGGLGPNDSLAAFLVPYLARGEVRLIAEATPTELGACRRLLPGLAELFQIVPVSAFDRTAALRVIDRQLETSASGRGSTIERGTGERIVRLFRRFQPYTVFPGAASAFARELVESRARRGEKVVSPADAVDQFRRRTGLPEKLLRDEQTLSRPDVLDWFRARVIDQPAACECAADVVMAAKAGIADPDKPPAVLLFCGPTGVGKTHTAQALADYLFGHGERTAQAPPRLVRLDMSEFGGYDAVDRLLGPAGGEPAELVRRIRREPFCVLLLDEIEKASMGVFDTLMGAFDEGRLTDQYGRVTNFRSAVIIMTSNLGAGVRGVGFGPNEPRYGDAARTFFRPEFYNRMDAVITFDSLPASAVVQIARRELAAIERRDGVQRMGLKLAWDESLLLYLTDVGCDARFGARPMQRAIERQVVAPLAKWLLAHPTAGGAVRVAWDGKQVVVDQPT